MSSRARVNNDTILWLYTFLYAWTILYSLNKYNKSYYR